MEWFFHGNGGGRERVGRWVNLTRKGVELAERQFKHMCNISKNNRLAGHEGRIGMVSIRLTDGCEFNGERLYRHVVDYLPNYARPRFARIQVVIYLHLPFFSTHVERSPKGLLRLLLQCLVCA